MLIFNFVSSLMPDIFVCYRFNNIEEKDFTINGCGTTTGNLFSKNLTCKHCSFIHVQTIWKDNKIISKRANFLGVTFCFSFLCGIFLKYVCNTLCWNNDFVYSFLFRCKYWFSCYSFSIFVGTWHFLDINFYLPRRKYFKCQYYAHTNKIC